MVLLGAANVAAEDWEEATSKFTFSKKDFVDTVKIKIVDGGIVIPTEIEGREYNMHFDTGCTQGVWMSAPEEWMTPIKKDDFTVRDANEQAQTMKLYRSAPIKMGGLAIEGYVVGINEIMNNYQCGVYDGIIGFDIVKKGLSMKIDTKDSVLVITDRKGFFAKEEKGRPYSKYNLPGGRPRPLVEVEMPFGKMEMLFDTGARNVWLHLPQWILDEWTAKNPKKLKDVDAVTALKTTTINSNIGLYGAKKDTMTERLLCFPEMKIGSLAVNDLWVTTASMSPCVGAKVLDRVSMIIDADKKRFVFLPHEEGKPIVVGNKEEGGLNFVPADEGETLGIIKAVVREDSEAYKQGVRTGDFVVEVDGVRITDICTFTTIAMKVKEKGKGEKEGKGTVDITFVSPDGTEKRATVTRTK